MTCKNLIPKLDQYNIDLKNDKNFNLTQVKLSIFSSPSLSNFDSVKFDFNYMFFWSNQLLTFGTALLICPDPSYLNLLTFWSRKSQKSWVKHIKSQEKSTTFILQLWNMTWLVFNDTTHVTKKRAELNSMIFLCLQKIIMIIF